MHVVCINKCMLFMYVYCLFMFIYILLVYMFMYTYIVCVYCLFMLMSTSLELLVLQWTTNPSKMLKLPFTSVNQCTILERLKQRIQKYMIDILFKEGQPRFSLHYYIKSILTTLVHFKMQGLSEMSFVYCHRQGPDSKF